MKSLLVGVLLVIIVPQSVHSRDADDSSKEHSHDRYLSPDHHRTDLQGPPPPRRLFNLKSYGDGKYRVPFITLSDMDSHLIFKESRGGEFKSMLWRSHYDFRVSFHRIVEYDGKMTYGGRGMEMSDLLVFNGRLYTVCDKTGTIFWVHGMKCVPWVIYSDGNGTWEKPSKTEWLTIKDGKIYAGGYGMEWLDEKGNVDKKASYNPMYVKEVTKEGAVRFLDWRNNYGAMRRRIRKLFPRYIIHESGQWSDIHRRWFFLPRKVSNIPFTDRGNEKMGGKVLLRANEDFTHISPVRVMTDDRRKDTRDGTRGFSAFQFLPNTNDELIVALKTVEMNDRPMATYLTVFHIGGQVLIRDTKIPGDFKMEGIEFIDWKHPYWQRQP